MKRSRLAGVSAKRKSQGPAYLEFRLGILARDQYRCCYCRTRSGPLDPHHTLKPRAKFLCDWNSVLTLCRKCHDWVSAAYSGRDGRLIVEPIGKQQFVFSIVRGASKFAVRAALPPLATTTRHNVCG